MVNYADAIAAVESLGSGGYSAIGPVTRKGNRAYGRYQVMDFNIGPWTAKHYGRALSPQEFLSNTEAQDAVFNGEFGSYVRKYGNPQDAASVWFSGRPMSKAGGASDGYTTVPEYVEKFNRALGSGPAQAARPRANLSTMTAPPQEAKMSIGDKLKQGVQSGSIWDAMALAANTMRHNPDPSINQMVSQRISDRKKAATANRTAAWLRQNGREDLAAAMETGALDGRSALAMAFQKPEDNSTAMQKNYEFLLAQGYTQEQALAGARGGQTINVNTGVKDSQYGEPPKDHVWARGDDGSVLTESVDIGGGQMANRPVSLPMRGTEADVTASDVESQRVAVINQADHMLETIEGALNDPALKYATGKDFLLGNVPGTGGRRAVARIEQIQGQVFLQAYERLKGGGVITEIEGQKAEAALARLDRAQRDEDFVAALEELRSVVVSAKRRAEVLGGKRANELSDKQLMEMYGN